MTGWIALPDGRDSVCRDSTLENKVEVEGVCDQEQVHGVEQPENVVNAMLNSHDS